MSEMVERMRAAFLQKLRELNTGVAPPACLSLDEPWIAAIEAMREPTDAMVTRGWELIRGNLRPDEIYPHMVDEALK